MTENDQKEVIIFLDVDGVLNDKWIGHIESFSKDLDSLHPQLVHNLGRLAAHLKTEQYNVATETTITQ